MAWTTAILRETRRTFDMDNSGATTVREFVIAGSDLLNMLADLWEPDYIEGLGFQLTKKDRHSDGTDGEFNWMVIDSLRIEPEEPDAPPAGSVHALTAYARLKVTLTYKAEHVVAEREDPTSEEINIPNETWLTHTSDGSVEAVVLSPHGLVTDDSYEDPIPEDTDTTTYIPTITHTFTWHKVATPPWGIMRAKIGQVNNGVWPPGAKAENQFADETLLFAGYSTSKDFDALNQNLYTVSYTFIEKRFQIQQNGVGGWNHVWAPDATNGPWVKVTDVGGTLHRYPATDLSPLFAPEAT